MQKRWILLFIFLAMPTLWFCAKAGYELICYARLSSHTKARVVSWEVEELSLSKLYLKCSYTFEVNGTLHEGKTRFMQPEFLNRPSAEQALTTFSSYSWSAWYAPKNPSFSSLQKLFPYKNSFSALISLGVLLYFYFLYRQTVSKKNLKIVL
jgi:hypothetical protein